MALKLLHLLLVLSFIGVDAAVFTLQNNCRNTVWPGIQGGEGKAPLMNGGLRLRSGETVNISAPEGWSGRFWGRSLCSFDQSGRGYGSYICAYTQE
nr:pathogenesis-related protein 5 [Quercus suber]